MTTLRVSKLFTDVTEESQHSSVKVTIVGAGQVGMAAAFALLTQGVVSELALVDNSVDKLKGEMLDLQHGQAFLRRVKVVASTDYAVTTGSKICVVTAGARQSQGETRLQLVQKNVAIFKNIIPNLVKYSPNCILVIVSNPVDVLTYVAWKISGFPRNQVIGSGTMLDSSRFRFLLSQKIGIAPSSCHGYIIGEHGDSSVAVWSSVNVAGTRIKDIHPEVGEANDPEKWDELHKEVVNSAYEIIKLKGYTSWAIGVMISTLCSSILKNQKIIYSLSTLAKGYHGIEDEVFLSLPCVVGEKGITAVFNQKLLPNEIEKVKNSAKLLNKIVKEISV